MSQDGEIFHVTGVFLQGIHQSSNPPHQWLVMREALILCSKLLSCWTNSGGASDLNHHGVHVTSMWWWPLGLYIAWHPHKCNPMRRHCGEYHFQVKGQGHMGHSIFIPPASTKLIGGYTGITLSVCPSVRLSVCGQNRVCSVSSRILIGSISYLHILSSNFRRCVACNAHFKIQKFEILAIFLNLWLWLCLLLTWDPIWLNGMGNHEAVGGILRAQAF